MKILQRLIVFLLGIPMILLVVHYSMPAFNAFLAITCALAAYELSTILGAKGTQLRKVLLMVLSMLIPIGAYFNSRLSFAEPTLSLAMFVLAVFIIFLTEIFSGKGFENSNATISCSICVVLYTGCLPATLASLSGKAGTAPYIMTFFLLVFMCDSAAWFFGILFGKNNRGKIAASPNKSIAGFVGAYAADILTAFLAAYLVFPKSFDAPIKALRVFLMAFSVCTASIVGDLAESVLKRSAGVKDSGKIILGRGGILDSVDSIFMAAPFFCFFVSVFFK